MMMMEFDLKEVFSILDENNEGQIQLRRFVDVANNYYSDAEQLARITKALDPKNTGLINFDQFCDGIAQISSLQGVSLKDVASDLSRISRENSLVEDSDQRSLTQDGSTTTFNEYDVESDETYHHQQKHHPTSSSQTPASTSSSTPYPQKTPHTNPANQSISPILGLPLSGDEEEFTGIAEPASSSVLSDLIYPTSTSSQRISHALKRTANNNIPVEEAEQQQLQETVEELQKTVEVLTGQKQKTTDRLAKIQSENSDLKSRLLALEDRFHDLEGYQARSKQSEQEKYAEYLNLKDRTFSQEKEILQVRINAIEDELKQTHTSNGVMKKDVKQLKEKLEDVDVQLQESQVRCNYLAEDNEKLLEQLRMQRQELEREKMANAQLAEQLTFDSSRQMFGQTLNRTESIIKTSEIRIQDLDAQVRALKLENEKLKQENEEMRERAVAAGIDEGRRLMANRGSQSYAAELEVLSKDELMSKLREQFTINDRLREYIERMLTVIIENSPQLLEVTMNMGMPMGMSPAAATSQPGPTMIISSKELEQTTLPSPQPLTATDSTKSDPATTTTMTAKPSNDKYCRL